MVNFGIRLKSLRIEKGYTQKQLADRVGLAISAISSYESGNRYPTYEVMVKFSKIFHVSTDYLLGVDNSVKIDLSGLDSESMEIIYRLIEKLRANN